MTRRLASPLPLLGLLLIAAPRPAESAMATFDLGTPTVTPTSASFEVALNFSGDPTDSIQAIQLSALGSDPLLTANDTDFSRFSFTLNGSTLPGWSELAPISSGGFGLYGPDDPVNGPFLSPAAGPIDLGTLSVDLSGIAGGTSLRVTLNGGPPGLGSDVGGVVGGNPVDSFATAGLLAFNQPNGVTFQTSAVPEPASLLLLALGAVGSLVRRRARARRPDPRAWQRPCSSASMAQSSNQQ